MYFVRTLYLQYQTYPVRTKQHKAYMAQFEELLNDEKVA